MATNVFKSVVAAVPSTGADIYPGPGGSKQAIVHSIYVSNVHASDPASIDIKVKNVTGDTYTHIAKNVPIPYGSSLVFDKPVDMSATGKIWMEATDALHLETVLGILEIDP